MVIRINPFLFYEDVKISLKQKLSQNRVALTVSPLGRHFECRIGFQICSKVAIKAMLHKSIALRTQQEFIYLHLIEHFPLRKQRPVLIIDICIYKSKVGQNVFYILDIETKNQGSEVFRNVLQMFLSCTRSPEDDDLDCHSYEVWGNVFQWCVGSHQPIKADDKHPFSTPHSEMSC